MEAGGLSRILASALLGPRIEKSLAFERDNRTRRRRIHEAAMFESCPGHGSRVSFPSVDNGFETPWETMCRIDRSDQSAAARCGSFRLNSGNAHRRHRCPVAKTTRLREILEIDGFKNLFHHQESNCGNLELARASFQRHQPCLGNPGCRAAGSASAVSEMAIDKSDLFVARRNACRSSGIRAGVRTQALEIRC